MTHSRLLTVALAIVAGGCNGPTQDCTLVGCHSGLTVHLDRSPVAPFRLELSSPSSPTVVVQQCPTATDCNSTSFFFENYVPEEVVVRVVTDTDTTLVTGLKPHYAELAPNGATCGPICHVATVEVALDQ